MFPVKCQFKSIDVLAYFVVNLEYPKRLNTIFFKANPYARDDKKEKIKIYE